MRFALSFLAVLSLAACATAPATPTAPVATNSAPAAQPSRIAQLLGAAGRDNAPTRADIERALGAPDVARQDGAGAALTYRLDTCALLLLFAADQRNALRLAEAHPSARTGGAAPSVEQCATEAGARRH